MKKLLIKKQINKKIIYDIYLEETFIGFLPRGSLFFICDKSLFTEDNINIFIKEEELDELHKKIYKYIWNRFYDFLMLREHSEWEAKQYLVRIHTPETLSDKFIETAKQKNYLNENRFIDVFIRSKISKNKSKREIKSSLFSRGVHLNNPDAVIDSYYSSEDEDEILKINFNKAMKKYSNLSENRKRKEKIINYLIRKGFNYYKIKEFIDSV